MTQPTLADVYQIAWHNEIVHAALTVYEANVERVPMYDVLIALVCALDERNQALQCLAERLLAYYGPLPQEMTL